MDIPKSWRLRSEDEAQEALSREPHLSDRETKIRAEVTARLDGLAREREREVETRLHAAAVEYLGSIGSTLWGQAFDISSDRRREEAADFIVDLYRDLAGIMGKSGRP